MAAGDLLNPTVKSLLLATQATNRRQVGCNTDGMLHTNPYTQFGVEQDLLANDSDKIFTVPANHIWLIHWVMVNLTTTATAGVRFIVCEFIDAAGNVLARTGGSTGVAASSNETFLFAGAQFSIAYASHDGQDSAFPNRMLLPAAFQLRVFDFAAIAAAADDMEVTIGRQEIDDT